MASQVRGSIQANERRPHSLLFSSYRNLFLADPRRGDWQRGSEDRIDFLEDGVELPSDGALHFQRVQVVHGADVAAQLKPAPDVFAVFSGMRGKISLRLVILRRFRERDVRARLNGMFKARTAKCPQS